MAPARRHVPLSLLVLLVLAAGLSVCWNVALPPLQGPDEIEHIAYVEAIGENGTIPVALLFTPGTTVRRPARCRVTRWSRPWRATS